MSRYDISEAFNVLHRNTKAKRLHERVLNEKPYGMNYNNVKDYTDDYEDIILNIDDFSKNIISAILTAHGYEKLSHLKKDISAALNNERISGRLSDVNYLGSATEGDVKIDLESQGSELVMWINTSNNANNGDGLRYVIGENTIDDVNSSITESDAKDIIHALSSGIVDKLVDSGYSTLDDILGTSVFNKSFNTPIHKLAEDVVLVVAALDQNTVMDALKVVNATARATKKYFGKAWLGTTKQMVDYYYSLDDEERADVFDLILKRRRSIEEYVSGYKFAEIGGIGDVFNTLSEFDYVEFFYRLGSASEGDHETKQVLLEIYNELTNKKQESFRLIVRKPLIEKEMSPEDKEDSDVIKDVITRTQARSNAKITPEQQKVMDKYGLSRDTYHDYGYAYTKITDKRNNNYLSDYYTKPKYNLADKLRKTNGSRGARRKELTSPHDDVIGRGIHHIEIHSEPTPGYNAEREHGLPRKTKSWEYDKNGKPVRVTELDPDTTVPKDDERAKERQRQATNMYRPYRDMKGALADRQKHQKKLDYIDKEYADDVSYANRQFNDLMNRAEERRSTNRRQGEKGLKDANDKINKLLKRDKQESLTRYINRKTFK